MKVLRQGRRSGRTFDMEDENLLDKLRTLRAQGEKLDHETNHKVCPLCNGSLYNKDSKNRAGSQYVFLEVKGVFWSLH